MARISGLDYAESTDYMTNALRSFKMEMQDAQRIVDVYSAVAASSATNVEQLAEAMSKTASSAEAVGSSFENTTAMMAVMIQATRQAPQNIGSALKSIISRYGELKVNPSTLVDSEGQALSLNKVDTALQSVGISIHNAQGQFRDFDDVIMELAKSWDTIDVNTQRYIATVMAGNRQQSRFLALVSSYDRLKEEAEIAANAQNAAQLQYLKTLDSIEAKQQQLKTSMQSLYTSTGIQTFYANLIDFGNSVIKTFTEMPTVFNLPIPALLKFSTTFYSLAKIVTTVFNIIKTDLTLQTTQLNEERVRAQRETQDRITAQARRGSQERSGIVNDEINQQNSIRAGHGKGVRAAQLIASGIGVLGNVLSTSPKASNEVKATGSILGGMGNFAGIGMSIGTALGGPVGTAAGGVAGAIIGALSAIPEAIDLVTESVEERVERLSQELTEATNQKLIADSELKTLTDYSKKWNELKKQQKEGNDVKAEQIALDAQIAANFPELIDRIDEEGNLVVELSQNYKRLAENKRKAAQESGVKAGATQLRQTQDMSSLLKQYGLSYQAGSVQYAVLANQSRGEIARSSNNPFKTLIQSFIGEDNVESFKNIFGSQLPGFKINNKQYRDSVIKFLEINNLLLNRTKETWDKMLQQGVPTNIIEEINQVALPIINSDKPIYLPQEEKITKQLTKEQEQLKQLQIKRLDGIVKLQISSLRQTQDMFYEAQETMTGVIGAYVNNQLQSSWAQFKDTLNQSQLKDQGYSQEEIKKIITAREKNDYATLWEIWGKRFNTQYYNLYQYAINEKTQEIAKTLNQYYQNIGSTSQLKYHELQSQFKDSAIWATFDAKYTQARNKSRKLLAQSLVNAGVASLEAAYNYIEKDVNNFTITDQQRWANAISQHGNKNNLNAFKNLMHLPSSNQQTILSIFENNTLDTISSIEAAINEYAQKELIGYSSEQVEKTQFVSLMRQFETLVKINFNTQYQSLADEYTKNLKQLDKALKGATSGMDNEDAAKLAAQLNTTLSDKNFQFLNGKWFYRDIKQVYDAFLPDETLLNVLNKFADEAGDFAYKTDLNEVPEQFRDTIKAFQKARQQNEKLTWNAWLEELRGNIEGLTEASKSMIASSWLDAGNIQKFIETVGKTNEITDQASLYDALISGQLSGQYEQYVEKLLTYYQQGTQEVYDAAVKLISGESATTSVKVTQSNQDLINSITGGSYKVGQIAAIGAQQIAKSWDELITDLSNNKALTFKQKVDQMAKFHNAGFEGNTYDAITSVIKSFEEFDISQALMLPESLREFAYMNQVTGKYFLDLNSAAKTLNDTYLKSLGWDNKQINELQATIHKSQRENNIKTIATDIVKNRESLTEENISSIATALNQTYDDIIATLQLQRNEDGTYRMNMNSILQLLDAKREDLGDSLAQMIAEEIDNIIGNVSGLTGNQSKGVTSYAEMQKAVKRAQQSGFDISGVGSLYEWSDAVHGFVLSAQGIMIEVARAQMELERVTAIDEQAAQLLRGQIQNMGRQLANNIDLSAFMQASNKNPGSEAAKTLTKAIDDYNSYLSVIGETTQISAEKLMTNLRKGGVDAVDAIKIIAKAQNREVTSNEISSAYRQSAERLLAASQELTSGVGEIVGEDANRLLKLSGASTQKLSEDSYLVLKSAEDLTLAYQHLYRRLKLSGQATLAQLNNIAAEYYNQKFGTKKGQLLDMLSDSAEMTYNQLAEMFTAAGWKFTTDTVDQLGNNLSQLNNGKVRINNFKGFAEALGIDITSPQYLDAFKTYNDALIEQNTKAKDNIANELKKISEAQPGQLINITYLTQVLGDSVADIFKDQGTLISDGIYQLSQEVNLPKLIHELADKAGESGKLLKSEAAELADTIEKMLQEFANAISQGLGGSLTNAGANALAKQAKNWFGLDLKFTQTYEGLKLSTDQAIKLYDSLKGVDTISSHIVFDSLTKQLTKAGEACDSMSHAMAEIKRLEKEGATAARERASVYREIANMQIQNPDSYDWMNKDLPDYLKGPENYWNSLGTAFKALNEAAKEAEESSTKAAHMLDPTDFYNMVNEFNNMAQISGTEIQFLGHKLNGDMTSAAQLIQEGMRTLSNVDGDGVKVDLSKFGVNFAGGAEGMAKGVHQGIQAMAKSQIEMLDGMIQLLETVVAMEGLKDVAGENNQIDLSELFPQFKMKDEKLSAYDNIKEWAKKLLNDTANIDLQKALNNIVVNGESLRQTLTKLSTGYKFSEQQAKRVQQELNALYQMYLSGDYSLQNLIGSIKQVFASSGFEGNVKVGNQTFYISQGYILEKGKDGWEVPGVGTFKNEKEALKAYELKQKTGAENITTTAGQAFGTINLGNQKVAVHTSVNGIKYNVDNQEFDTQNEVTDYLYDKYKDQWLANKQAGNIQGKLLDKAAWKLQMNIPAEPSVTVANEEEVKQKIASATHEQITKIAQLLATGEWSSDLAELVVPFGIQLKPTEDNKLLQTDIEKIAGLTGIDTKIMSLSLATEVVGDNAENVKKILAGEALTTTVNIEVGQDQTGLIKTKEDITLEGRVIGVNYTKIKDILPITGWDQIWANVPFEKQDKIKALVEGIDPSCINGVDEESLHSTFIGWRDGIISKDDFQESSPLYTYIEKLEAARAAGYTDIELTALVEQSFIDAEEHAGGYERTQQLAVFFDALNGFCEQGGLDTSDADQMAQSLIQAVRDDPDNGWKLVTYATAMFQSIKGAIATGWTFDPSVSSSIKGLLMAAAERKDSDGQLAFQKMQAITILFDKIKGAINGGWTIDSSVNNSINGLITLASERGQEGNRAFEKLQSITLLFNEIDGVIDGGWTFSDQAIASINGLITLAAERPGEEGLGAFERLQAVTAVLNQLNATIQGFKFSDDFQTKINDCIARGNYKIPQAVFAVLNALQVSYPEDDINRIDTTGVADQVLEVVTTNAELFTSSEGQKVIAQLTSLTAEDKIDQMTDEDKATLQTIIDNIISGNITLFQGSAQLKALIDKITTAPKKDADLTPEVSEDVLPKGPVNLGERQGIVNITGIDFKGKTGVGISVSDLSEKELRRKLGWGGISFLGDLFNWGDLHGPNATKELKGSSEFANQVLAALMNVKQSLQTEATRVLQPFEIDELLTLKANADEFTINGQSVPDFVDTLLAMDTQKKDNAEFQANLFKAFNDIDVTNLQACAQQMSKLAESAQKVHNVPWAEIVDEVNRINAPQEQSNSELQQVSEFTRIIKAIFQVEAAPGDTVAQQVIKGQLQRTIKLLVDAKELDKKLEQLKNFNLSLNNSTTINQTGITTVTSQINAPDTKVINDLIAEIQGAITQAKDIFNTLTGSLTELSSKSDSTSTVVDKLANSITNIPQGRDQRVGALAAAMDRIPAVSGRISALNAQLSALNSTPISINLEVSGGTSAKGTANGIPFGPEGPAHLSFAQGNAKVLMGQLGPELVVSNGRYFVVGAAGAQMVSLPKDAIVFNHLQTQQLLKREKIGGRGKPITNQRNAVSRAKGTGNAMASASAALAALKQIRAMWQSMLGATMKDLGSLAGQEAGKASKNGGGGGKDNDLEQIKAVVEEIERWYNLLRQIDKLQKDITYQQNLQSKIESNRVANGKALYNSYKEQIKYLDQEIIKNQQLADLQKSWYERKRQELVESDYGKIFTYDENGQLQYRQGVNLGLDVLEKLTRRDIYGQTQGVAQNAETQINYLRSIGFDVEKLKYNDDGTYLDEADYQDNPEQIYVDMMQNYWDRLDGWKDQLDSIYDSYTDQLNEVISNETKRNQLLQKIIDNQLSVEQDVLHAIESREQKLIDELQDQRDALEKSNKDFLDGLTDQLNQQKQMYKNAESEKELFKLRRQLAILQRSGGSGSQIRSLQDQIAAKEQDQYFTAQQQQIAAIQKASDLQIERMDSQIDLMTQTLEYQKENGLLWQEVYQIMASTPQQIRQFIVENTPDFQSASALDVAEKIRDIDLRINEWVGYRDDEQASIMTDHYYDWDSYSAARTEIYGNRASNELISQAKQEFNKVLNATSDINAAGAAADAIFRAVLGDKPKMTEVLENGIINTIADNVSERIQSDIGNIGNNYSNNSNNYINTNNTKKNANSNSTNTNSSDSNKTTWTFSAYGSENDSVIMAGMDALQKQIDASLNNGIASTAIKNKEDQFNKLYDSLVDVRNKKKYSKYISGGLVNYTGLAQVDGTPQRPEAFLNAQQTKLLRDNLFGSSNSLLALANQIVQQLHGTSYSLNTTNTEQTGLNIEKIDVNINVDQVANDYDVRAMGDVVMDEILMIARKSGTRGLSRR